VARGGKGATFLRRLTSLRDQREKKKMLGSEKDKTRGKRRRAPARAADSACGACQIYVDFLADLAHVFILSYTYTHTARRQNTQANNAMFYIKMLTMPAE
jgi:hypothetical protein